MRRTILALSGVAAAAALAVPNATAGVAVPAAAGNSAVGGDPVVVHPNTLPPGRDPDSTYLVGRTIHPKTGQPIRIGLPSSLWGGLRLLGRGDRGWVVASHGERFRVYNVSSRGVARAFISADSYAGDAEWRLGQDGSRVLSWSRDRSGVTNATVYNLDGRAVGRRTFNALGHVLHFAGPSLIATVDRTVSWRPGSRPAQLTPRSSRLAAPGRDVLFVVRDDGRVGPTKLSAPGTPRWLARFDATRISPNGRYVVGRRQDGEGIPGNVLEVRRMADGHLVRAFRVADNSWLSRAKIWWESDGAFLFRVETARGRAVVRCWIGGTCNRATRWVTDEDADFSIPFENHTYGD